MEKLGMVLPQSLFARLMWVLLAGLIIAQLLSAAINFDERDRLLFKASGIQYAQRIADTVQWLDPLMLSTICWHESWKRQAGRP